MILQFFQSRRQQEQFLDSGCNLKELVPVRCTSFDRRLELYRTFQFDVLHRSRQ